MALPRSLGKSKLQALYGKTGLNKFNLHHMIPRTRGGDTSEFNLYPYRIKSHNAYHGIFLNMTIWEVWDVLDEAYEVIFNTEDERVNRYWLHVCRLGDSDEKRSHIERDMNVRDLQEKWEKAFGGRSLQRAKKTLKHMMLFIIFGSKMSKPERLFDNGNLEDFLQRYPADDDRLRAFTICFGQYADYQKIKARMSKIIR